MVQLIRNFYLITNDFDFKVKIIDNRPKLQTMEKRKHFRKFDLSNWNFMLQSFLFSIL